MDSSPTKPLPQPSRRDRTLELEPILVSVPTAKSLLGVGNTKFWKMVKVGKIKLVDTGTGRNAVAYSSLKKLGP